MLKEWRSNQFRLQARGRVGECKILCISRVVPDQSGDWQCETSTKTLKQRQEQLELCAAEEVPAKKGLEVIKKIGATSTQQKSSAPANAVTDAGSKTPWAAPHLDSSNRLKVLMFAEAVCL